MDDNKLYMILFGNFIGAKKSTILSFYHQSRRYDVTVMVISIHCLNIFVLIT